MRDRPTWLISRAYARATGLLQEGFAAGGDGLRSYHYRLLAALEEWGPASQAALGRGTGIDRSDVTAALVDLEQRGLVKRDVNEADRRRNVVSITAGGLRRLEELDGVPRRDPGAGARAAFGGRAEAVHHADAPDRGRGLNR